MTAGYPGDRPIRVVVVGLGWAARSIWLPRLRAHPDFQVVAAVDPDPDARTAVARDSGVPVLASSEALAPSRVDLAVVAVPNHLHCPVACRLLRAGIPAFLEKPVCLTSDEAALLAEAERAGGSVLLAGSAARYRADVRALAGLTAQIGTVRHIDLMWIRARGVPQARGWFTRRQLAGGGALVDLGWHLLDTLGPVLGPATFDEVVGTVSDDFVNHAAHRAAWRHDAAGADPDGPGDVEDTARGFLVTSDGVSVSIRASWASHEPRDITVLTVEGSSGIATLRCTFGFSPNRLRRSILTLTRDGGTVPVPVPEEPVGSEYLRQLDELPVQLADPASRGRAVAEAGRTVNVIQRIYASAQRTRGRAALPVGAGR